MKISTFFAAFVPELRKLSGAQLLKIWSACAPCSRNWVYLHLVLILACCSVIFNLTIRVNASLFAMLFGLVNIPVGLYTATQSAREVKFRLLRDDDLSPIHYKRVAEADGKEVDWDHIVKGYEYEKGQFVVLKEEDFQQVQIKSTQIVDI